MCTQNHMITRVDTILESEADFLLLLDTGQSVSLALARVLFLVFFLSISELYIRVTLCSLM